MRDDNTQIVNQLKAFKESGIAVYIITFDDYFYGGDIQKLTETFALIEDLKIGKIPITFSNIKKLTKFKPNERDDDKVLLSHS